jgi:hypothetical protein
VSPPESKTITTILSPLLAIVPCSYLVPAEPNVTDSSKVGIPVPKSTVKLIAVGISEFDKSLKSIMNEFIPVFIKVSSQAEPLIS